MGSVIDFRRTILVPVAIVAVNGPRPVLSPFDGQLVSIKEMFAIRNADCSYYDEMFVSPSRARYIRQGDPMLLTVRGVIKLNYRMD
jgi:hypothetical protein